MLKKRKEKKEKDKWAKDLVNISQKEDIQIANKHKERDSISLIRETQN